VLKFATINLSTKCEVAIFISTCYKDIKGHTKNRKQGGLGS